LSATLRTARWWAADYLGVGGMGRSSTRARLRRRDPSGPSISQVPLGWCIPNRLEICFRAWARCSF
jgi:hypothetical protein